MSIAHGKECVIITNGFNLTQFFTSFTGNPVAEVADVTTLGDTWREFIAGLKNSTLSLEGFYDGADDADVEFLEATLGAASNFLFAIFPQGATVGSDGMGFAGFGTGFSITANLGGAVSINGSVQSNIGMEPGKSLQSLVSVTGTGDGTAVNNTASSANGAVSQLHVIAFNGTDATIKVQDSPDNVTYADLITHTQVTAVNAKERSTVAGTVDQYLRRNITGTFTSITFALLVSRY